MRNRAAALLILTLATGCSHTPQPDEQPTPPIETPTSTATSTDLAPTKSLTSTQQRTPTTTDTRPSTPTATTEPAPSAPTPSDPAAAASRFVQQLIEHSATPANPDHGLWTAVVADGQIIQTTPLATSADRATVAVSIAFDTPPDRTITEPIGLRVELLHTVDGWTVLAVGYL